MAGYFQKTSQLDSAEYFYTRSLEMVRAKFPPLYPELAPPLVGLGHVLLQKDDVIAAEPLLREGLRIRTLRLPEGHSRIAYSQSLLGESLARQDKQEEAGFLLTAGYQGLKARYGEDHPRVKEARDRLNLLRN